MEKRFIGICWNPFKILHQNSEYEKKIHLYKNHNDFLKDPVEGSLIITFEINFTH